MTGEARGSPDLRAERREMRDMVMEEGDRMAALAEAKALLRATSGEEDALLGRLIDEALEVAEAFIGQVTIVRTIEERVAADGRWQRLRACPVRAVVAAEAHAIDIDPAGDGWVRVQPGDERHATVTYEAGLASGWDALAPSITGGIVRLAAHRFAARDDDAVPPAAVAALWRPWRRMRLAERAPA